MYDTRPYIFKTQAPLTLKNRELRGRDSYHVIWGSTVFTDLSTSVSNVKTTKHFNIREPHLWDHTHTQAWLQQEIVKGFGTLKPRDIEYILNICRDDIDCTGLSLLEIPICSIEDHPSPQEYEIGSVIMTEQQKNSNTYRYIKLNFSKTKLQYIWDLAFILNTLTLTNKNDFILINENSILPSISIYNMNVLELLVTLNQEANNKSQILYKKTLPIVEFL